MSSQFDVMGDTYDEFALGPFRQYLETPSVIKFLGDVKGLSVLDFGCGSGVYSRILKKRGAARVVGYDVSEGMLEHARLREERDHLGIDYVSSLDESLYGSFDVVLGVYVIPYANTRKELDSMINTMAKLLKPDGRLLTLPIHPEISDQPDYYKHYGFRIIPQEPYDNGSKITLDLQQDTLITAYYWPSETLQQSLALAGFKEIDWHKHYVTPDGYTQHGKDYWDAYLNKPHAAILECSL